MGKFASFNKGVIDKALWVIISDENVPLKVVDGNGDEVFLCTVKGSRKLTMTDDKNAPIPTLELTMYVNVASSVEEVHERMRLFSVENDL